MKTKKIIYSIGLTIILLLSSFLLMACGNKSSSKKTFEGYNSIMSKLESDTELFTEQTINNFPTKFYINNLAHKESDGSLNEDYNNYVSILSIGLEFISEYYPQLDGLKLETDYEDLTEDAKNLDKSYNNLKSEHQLLLNEATDLDYRLYNGYFARYRTATLNFINQTYDCAVSLGNFLNNKVKLASSVGTENMTTEAFEFYCDYNLLKIYDDYREFFMESCKGVRVENDFYNNSRLQLSDWVSSVSSKGYKIISVENTKSLMTIFNRVNNDRKLTNKALSKFSIYKYSTTYENSLLAYSKSSSNAPMYYERIETYFWDAESTLNNLINYLVLNVVA